MSRRARKSAAASRANGAGGNAPANRGGGGAVVPLQQPTTSQGMMGPNNEWFGPGRPLPGMGPRASVGRRYDYSFGQNVLQGPRADQRVSFAMLRQLADGHDLTRLAIETRKDQMSRLQFTFGVVDSEDDLTPEQDARAKRYRQMLRRPDGVLFWKDWLRSLLEDLLVIDAPSIFVRRTVDETEVVGLCQVDGATIKPVIDQWGRPPQPPECAYQQFIKGVPAFNYTTQTLAYRPRNVRVHTIYGYSPVEQIIATINIALRRQLWQHAYFTNGNIPDSLIGVPSTWSPDQIRDFQDWFDGVLTGNTERRRGALFVPGEVAKSYVPTKDAEMFGHAEEWFARVVCFCFGISHQALVKEVNRSTSETAAAQALDDGLAPIMGWVKSVMDGILLDQLGETELEFRWVDDKEMDPKAQDEIWKARVDSGAFSRNEWRAAVGEEPRPEPEADMLMTNTAETASPISLDAQIDQQRRRTDSGVFPTPPTTSSAGGGAEGTDGDEGGNLSSSSTPQTEEGASKAALPFALTPGGETASKYSEDQERDENGRFAGGGGGDEGSGGAESEGSEGGLLSSAESSSIAQGLSDQSATFMSQERRDENLRAAGISEEGIAEFNSWQESIAGSTETSLRAGEQLAKSSETNGELYRAFEAHSALEESVYNTRFSDEARQARFESDMRSSVWGVDSSSMSMEQVAEHFEAQGRYELADVARAGTPPHPMIFRGGTSGERVIESWTRDARGANIGGARIAVNHSSSIPQKLASGYRIAGGFTRMMGAPGEAEVTLVNTARLSARKMDGGTIVRKSASGDHTTILARIGAARPAAVRLRTRLQRVLEDGLATVGARVAAAAAATLETSSKANNPTHDETIRVALGAVGSWDFLIDPVADVLADLAEDTTREAVAMIGDPRANRLVDQVSERSVEQARARAAELVGRRVLADGSIIDNPDARWAITEPTRDMIRQSLTDILEENLGSDEFISRLEGIHAFSPARAEMVSRTEIAAVNSRASMESYEAAREAGVSVMKEWILGQEPCEICEANAAQGPIDLDDEFDSGDDEPPAHPNCECAVSPVVGEDS